MKKVIAKAKKYESRASLNGKMRYLKGNVGRITKNKIPC
jgi:hypothetical protein